MVNLRLNTLFESLDDYFRKVILVASRENSVLKSSGNQVSKNDGAFLIFLKIENSPFRSIINTIYKSLKTFVISVMSKLWGNQMSENDDSLLIFRNSKQAFMLYKKFKNCQKFCVTVNCETNEPKMKVLF